MVQFGFLLIPVKYLVVLLGAAVDLVLGLFVPDKTFLTVEDILFNQIPLTSIDFFDFSTTDSTILAIRENVAGWYVAMRNIAIIILVVISVYVAIRIALSSIAEEQAKYKEMLRDWIFSLSLLIVLHYVIIFIIQLNNTFISILANSINASYGQEQTNFAAVFRDEALKITNVKLSEGMANAICYDILVGITLVYLITYLKRMITVAFLIIIAPLVTVTYSIDKMGDGKSQALNIWFQEFIYNILIQPFHCVAYLALGSIAINMLKDNTGLENALFAIIILVFILKSEDIIKHIFHFRSQSMSTALGNAGFAIAMTSKLTSVGKNKFTSGDNGGKSKFQPRTRESQVAAEAGGGGTTGAGETGAGTTPPRLTTIGDMGEGTGDNTGNNANLNTGENGNIIPPIPENNNLEGQNNPQFVNTNNLNNPNLNNGMPNGHNQFAENENTNNINQERIPESIDENGKDWSLRGKEDKPRFFKPMAKKMGKGALRLARDMTLKEVGLAGTIGGTALGLGMSGDLKNAIPIGDAIGSRFNLSNQVKKAHVKDARKDLAKEYNDYYAKMISDGKGRFTDEDIRERAKKLVDGDVKPQSLQEQKLANALNKLKDVEMKENGKSDEKSDKAVKEAIDMVYNGEITETMTPQVFKDKNSEVKALSDVKKLQNELKLDPDRGARNFGESIAREYSSQGMRVRNAPNAAERSREVRRLTSMRHNVENRARMMQKKNEEGEFGIPREEINKVYRGMDDLIAQTDELIGNTDNIRDDSNSSSNSGDNV